MNINYEQLKSYEMINVFEYYDFPLVFISKSPSQKYYLNYYIEELEDGSDKWFLSEISNMERLDILGQRTSLLELLTKLKETLRLRHLIIAPEGETFKTEYDIVNNTNFDSDSFPEDDFYAEYDYLTKTELVKIEQETLNASKFKLVLKDIANSHDIGLDLFLDVLGNFKQALNGVAHDIGGLVENMSWKIDSLQPSSFGVYLKAENNDLFHTSEKSLGKMFELIEQISTRTEETIEDAIDDGIYSMCTIKEVNMMLKVVRDNHYSFALETKAEDETEVKVKFDKDSYKKLDKISNFLLRTETNSEKITVQGTLISIHSTSNKFNIKTPETSYSGKMSKQLFQQVKTQERTFKVPNEITATLIKETSSDAQGGNVKVKYTLSEFNQINNVTEETIENDDIHTQNS